MKIIMARHAGFCSGVKKAVNIALNEAGTGSKHTIGPLIHNKHVVEDLKEKGIIPIDSIDDIKEGTVIIRSHGVTPSILQKAKDKGLNIIDATCPFVKKAQKIVYDLSMENHNIVIVGDHGHPEVEALLGWSGDRAYIVKSSNEVNNLMLDAKEQVALIAQTTQPEENLQNVLETLEKEGIKVKVFNTICRAAYNRQEAAKALANQVDVMIVIGGYDSANTLKLVDLCSKLCPTYHIEDYEALDKKWFESKNIIGITAGASTPDWIIEGVIEKMTHFNEDKPELEKQADELEEKETAEVEKEEGNLKNTEAQDNSDEEYELSFSENNKDKEAKEEKSEKDNNDMYGYMNDKAKTLNKWDIVKGKVVRVDKEEVMVDIGGKTEGIIPLNELSVFPQKDPLNILQSGDEVEVQVIKVEDKEGNPILSKKRADRIRAWEKLQIAYDNDTIIEGKVIEVVKGGVLVDVGLRGFIPASLIGRSYIENLENYLDENLRLKVIELDKSKNKLVLSQKAVLDEEQEKKRNETWNSLKEGKIITGTIQRLTDFGAFVDIGGIDGLLHVSEISWGRVEYPKDVLEEGQEIEVQVLNLDKEKDRISLSLKRLLDNPWHNIDEKYSEGSIVKGKVVRTTSFGAFVEIEPGIEGLVHISQLAEEHVKKTEDVLSVGDEIPVKIMSMNSQEQKMSLSLKEAQSEINKNSHSASSDNNEANVQQQDDPGIKIGDLYGDLLKKRSNENE